MAQGRASAFFVAKTVLVTVRMTKSVYRMICKETFCDYFIKIGCHPKKTQKVLTFSKVCDIIPLRIETNNAIYYYIYIIITFGFCHVTNMTKGIDCSPALPFLTISNENGAIFRELL